jgi:hypothetical protein
VRGGADVFLVGLDPGEKVRSTVDRCSGAF